MLKIFAKMFTQYPCTVNLADRSIPGDDLLSCTRPILKVGQLAALFPIQGLWKKNLDDTTLVYKRNTLVGVLNAIFAVIMVLNVVMNAAGMTRKIMSGQTNPIQISWAIAPVIFYAVGTYVFIHFSMYAEKLIALYSNWRRTSEGMTYTFGGGQMMWKVRFWSAVVMISAFGENLMYHTGYYWYQTDGSELDLDGKKYLKHMGNSFLEVYYWREHGSNWAHFPYNPAVAVVLFFVNKLAIFTTNYADVTIVSLAWLMSVKLKDFNEQVASRIDDEGTCWLQVRKEFMGLYRLFEQIHSFLSPLIFASYMLLVELLGTQIYLGITTDAERPVGQKVYSLWSFIHLVVRFLLISVVCSRVPERCNDLLVIIQKCPSDKFCEEVGRLERLLATPIAFTGLGCFRITKSFILSVIHVIFTCEIIYLQTGVSTQPNKL